MNATRSRQRGAALVVGLVLLLILTLLAISGMNTATTELIMAGNEQYQARAFQAAETGIEIVIGNRVFDANPTIPRVPARTDFSDGDPLTDDDSVTTLMLPRGSSGPPPGASFSVFGTEHFAITSQGQSLRNASSTHTQGLFVAAPAPP